ncbi:MAG: hypothetical protein IIB14_05845 [Chloroflexi bacterium]|nr:hypothetical protein [Chloroflexota bacterium]
MLHKIKIPRMAWLSMAVLALSLTVACSQAEPAPVDTSAITSAVQQAVQQAMQAAPAAPAARIGI